MLYLYGFPIRENNHDLHFFGGLKPSMRQLDGPLDHASKIPKDGFSVHQWFSVFEPKSTKMTTKNT
jgi:hypothetical protein